MGSPTVSAFKASLLLTNPRTPRHRGPAFAAALCVAASACAQQTPLPNAPAPVRLPATSAPASTLPPATAGQVDIRQEIPEPPAKPAGPRLSLIDVLQATLKQNPQLILQQYNDDIQAGALQTARGQFNTTLNAVANQQRGYVPLTQAGLLATNIPDSGLPYTDTTVTNTSTIVLSATKQYRNGFSLTPEASLTRLTDNLSNSDGLNQAQIGLTFSLPLLRNRGRAAVDAGEISADKLLKATRMDLSQSVSDTIATAVQRYWAYVAAQTTVELYSESEKRSADVLAGSEELVKADRLPANDLNQVRATLASRVSSRIGAEQQLVLAQQQLVLVMGLQAEDVLTLPPPSDPLPYELAPFDTTALAGYIHEANAERADVLAAQLRVDANNALQAAARNGLKPQLDVTGNAGYLGQREGTGLANFPDSIFTTPKGLNYQAGVVYSQTPANDAAKGRLLTAIATTKQSQVALSETSRNAATTVVTAVTGVTKALAQVRRSQEALKYYQVALRGEKEKYQLRLNALVDVLTVEDLLTGATFDLLNARLAYANAIALLRQSTGTILQAGDDVQRIDPLLFYQLPPTTLDIGPVRP